MGELKDRVAGAVNETIGKAKQAIGGATDNERLQAEGASQEAKGDMQTAAGKTRGAAKDFVDKL